MSYVIFFYGLTTYYTRTNIQTNKDSSVYYNIIPLFELKLYDSIQYARQTVDIKEATYMLYKEAENSLEIDTHKKKQK